MKLSKILCRIGAVILACLFLWAALHPDKLLTEFCRCRAVARPGLGSVPQPTPPEVPR